MDEVYGKTIDLLFGERSAHFICMMNSYNYHVGSHVFC